MARRGDSRRPVEGPSCSKGRVVGDEVRETEGEVKVSGSLWAMGRSLGFGELDLGPPYTLRASANFLLGARAHEAIYL